MKITRFWYTYFSLAALYFYGMFIAAALAESRSSLWSIVTGIITVPILFVVATKLLKTLEND